MWKHPLSLLTALLLAPLAARQAHGKDQYLLLNYSTSLTAAHQASDMMTYVHDKFGAANRASALKGGVADAVLRQKTRRLID